MENRATYSLLTNSPNRTDSSSYASVLMDAEATSNNDSYYSLRQSPDSLDHSTRSVASSSDDVGMSMKPNDSHLLHADQTFQIPASKKWKIDSEVNISNTPPSRRAGRSHVKPPLENQTAVCENN